MFSKQVFQSGLFIRPKKQNENTIWKGVDEKKTWNVESDDRKNKTRENKKPRVFLKKSLGGGGKGRKEQNVSRIAGNPFSVALITTPLWKTPELQGKRR